MRLQTSAGLLLLAAIVAAGLWDLRPSVAQSADAPTLDPPPTTGSAPPTALIPPAATAAELPSQEPKAARYFFYDGKKDVNAVYGGSDKSINLIKIKGNRQAEQALHQAAAALRDAKDDAAKTAAQTRLTEMLNQYFDADMSRRESELAKVEARLKSLREQAARRQQKKSEIVELQIKVLLNEADGLGFFSEAPSSSDFDPGVEPSSGYRRWNYGPNDLFSVPEPSNPLTSAAGAIAPVTAAPAAAPAAASSDPFAAPALGQ